LTTVAKFSIDFTQYLNSEGKLMGDAPTIAEDFETLLKLYRTMVLIRQFDAKAIKLQRTGIIGTYASILGQEAISTVIGELLLADDIFVPFYRDHAALYSRGVGLHEILAYWGGDERGNDYQHNRHDLPMAVPIASQLLHACGAAFSCQYRAEPRVTLATCGDGATSQGDFYEALNVAGAWNLPVIFVINNNQWAISVPRSAQTQAQTLAQKAIAAGIPGLQVDGNDAIALYACLQQAIANTRAGKGPILIEALSYRLGDHTTADDAGRYRDSAELEQAWQREPIKRLRAYLQQQGHWNDALETELKLTCQTEIDAAVHNYQNSPPQPISAMFAYHFATCPEQLAAQQHTAETNDA
jgi:2-oxoisovalerate dehydrogenase E1 component subunit alpha